MSTSAHLPTKRPPSFVTRPRKAVAFQIGKIIRRDAAKSKDSDNSRILVPVDSSLPAVRCHFDYFANHQAQPGGWYVKYADGTETFYSNDDFQRFFEEV